MGMRNQIIGTYTVKISIALLILLVGGFLFLRFDASRDKVYSLSKHSRQVMRSLKDPVTIKVFASRDMTAQLAALNRRLKDMLTEFENQSKGKLRFEYARSTSNEDLIRQAMENGIQPYRVVTMENDKEVSKDVVLGLNFEGSGKSGSMLLRPGMESMMEYQILKQLNKIDGQSLPEITVFADSTALMYQYSTNPDEIATFFLELMENYRVIHTDLMKATKPTSVMLCLGVIDSLQTQQLYHLDQYLMHGGKVVMCQDRAAIYTTPQGSAVVEIRSNLFRMLEHYGVLIKPNIVLDRACEIRQGAGLGTQTPYPFFPLVRPNDKYPYAKGFDDVYLYLASELATPPGAKLKLEPILQTSNQSNTLVGPVFKLETAINQGLDPSYLNMPPLTVAAKYTGKLQSFFQPAVTDSTYKASVDEAEIILYGDSELPMDFGAGAFMILNTIDYQLGRMDMLKLRSPHQVKNRLGVEVYMGKHKLNPIDPEKTIKQLTLIFKLTAIFLPTLLLLIFGVVLFIIRSIRNK